MTVYAPIRRVGADLDENHRKEHRAPGSRGSSVSPGPSNPGETYDVRESFRGSCEILAEAVRYMPYIPCRATYKARCVQICCQSSWMTSDTLTRRCCCESILEDGGGVCGGVGVGRECGWARQGVWPGDVKAADYDDEFAMMQDARSKKRRGEVVGSETIMEGGVID